MHWERATPSSLRGQYQGFCCFLSNPGHLTLLPWVVVGCVEGLMGSSIQLVHFLKMEASDLLAEAGVHRGWGV